MDEIQVSAVFPKIAPGDLAEFKRAAAQVLELTIPEPGVVGYAWFFNEDETTCEVRLNSMADCGSCGWIPRRVTCYRRPCWTTRSTR